ncbi:MAG: receptor ligand binding family protein, partial [Okeania sp. SIO2H7]|nr:receptor ligand binding family protein [Okeania sp. SIO2H7]
MSQKNDAPILMFALLVTLGLLGAGGWWLYKTFIPDGAAPLGNVAVPPPNAIPPLDPGSTARTNDSTIPQFSQGALLLFADGISAEKRAGVNALANQDYAIAIQQLETSLQAQRNDPEALIYLNNAYVGAAPAYTIA